MLTPLQQRLLDIVGRLLEAGIEWRREVVSDPFARLTVETGHEECRIGLVVDELMRLVDRAPRVGRGLLRGDLQA